MAEAKNLPKLELQVRLDLKRWQADTASAKRTWKIFKEAMEKSGLNLKDASAAAKAEEMSKKIITKELEKQAKAQSKVTQEALKTVKASDQFNKSTKRGVNLTNQQAKALNDKNKKVRLASTQLSYAIDDMQYGFRGVQNNIAQVALMMGAGGPLMIGITLLLVTIATLLRNKDKVIEKTKGMAKAMESFNDKIRKGTLQKFGDEIGKMVASIDLLRDRLLEGTYLMDNFVKGSLKLDGSFDGFDIGRATGDLFEKLYRDDKIEKLSAKIGKDLVAFHKLLGPEVDVSDFWSNIANMQDRDGMSDRNLIETGLLMSGKTVDDYLTKIESPRGGSYEYGSITKIENKFKSLKGEIDEIAELYKAMDPPELEEDLPEAPDAGFADMSPMARALSEARFKRSLHGAMGMDKMEISKEYLKALEAALKLEGTAEERLATERAISIEYATRDQMQRQLDRTAMIDDARKELSIADAILGKSSEALQLRIDSNKEQIRSGLLSDKQIEDLEHANELLGIQVQQRKKAREMSLQNLDRQFQIHTAPTTLKKAELKMNFAQQDLKVLQDEISLTDMVIEGMKEEQRQIDKTSQRYKELAEAIKNLTHYYKDLKEEEPAKIFKADTAAHDYNELLKKSTDETEKFVAGNLIASSAIKMFQGSFQALGKGDEEGVFKALLGPLGDFMIQLGKGLVLTGIGKEALAKLWSPAGGIGAIAGGAALIAGGALIKGAQSANPAGGSGASASVSAVTDRAVANPQRQQGYGSDKLEARVTGQDLRFILEKASVSQRLYD